MRSSIAKILLLLVVAAVAGYILFAIGNRQQTHPPIASAPQNTTISRLGANPPEHGLVDLEDFRPAKTLVRLPYAFNRHLSLLVTDIDAVNTIKFSEVMAKIASQAENPQITKESLFQQWWDTANKAPGLKLGGHCNDIPPADKSGLFTYTCPRKEGEEVKKNGEPVTVFGDEPDNPSAYSAIAVSNRADLLSPPQLRYDGYVFPDCGEYRIIFARNTGRTLVTSAGTVQRGGDIFKRNLIAFEARIRNPDQSPQETGDAFPTGCLPILKFWQNLSDPKLTGGERGRRIHDFFMLGKLTGVGGANSITPVVDARNYTGTAGQIRTNQFMNRIEIIPGHDATYGSPAVPPSIVIDPNDWTLREFKILMEKRKLSIVPVTTKSTPGTALFKPGTAGDPRYIDLLNEIDGQTVALLGGLKDRQFKNIGDINAISFFQPMEGANAYESDETHQDQGDIVKVFSAGNTKLASEIEKSLNAVNAPADFKAMAIVDRIRTQTCAGCHQYSDTIRNVAAGTFGFDPPGTLGGNAIWPTKACGDVDNTCILAKDRFLLTSALQHPPMQFTQVSEVILTPSAGDNGKGWRYSISATVECFLDGRQRFAERALGLQETKTNNCPH